MRLKFVHIRAPMTEINAFNASKAQEERIIKFWSWFDLQNRFDALNLCLVVFSKSWSISFMQMIRHRKSHQLQFCSIINLLCNKSNVFRRIILRTICQKFMKYSTIQVTNNAEQCAMLYNKLLFFTSDGPYRLPCCKISHHWDNHPHTYLHPKLAFGSFLIG